MDFQVFEDIKTSSGFFGIAQVIFFFFFFFTNCEHFSNASFLPIYYSLVTFLSQSACCFVIKRLRFVVTILLKLVLLELVF